MRFRFSTHFRMIMMHAGGNNPRAMQEIVYSKEDLEQKAAEGDDISRFDLLEEEGDN